MIGSRILISFVLTIALTGSTGCRFGNFTSKDTQLKDDGFTGFYRTAATRLNYCVKLKSEAEQICAPADLAYGLSDWSNLISDPVALTRVPNDSTRVFLFTDLETDTGFYLTKSSDTAFSATLSVSSDEFSADCVGLQGFPILGQVQRSSGLPPVNGSPISGRALFNAQWIYQFDETVADACDAPRTAIEACYHDANDCTGADADERLQTQTRIQRIFADAVASGVLDPTRIDEIEYFGYIMIYQ